MDIGEAEFEQPANEIAIEPEAKLPGILDYYVRRFRANRIEADRRSDTALADTALANTAPAAAAVVRPLIPRKV